MLTLKQLHVAAVPLALSACATVSTVDEASVSVTAGPLRSTGGQSVRGVHTGAATVVRGYHLSAVDPRFGGFSGIALSADGTALVLVSDRGTWARARPHYDAEMRLVALSGWRMGRLRGPDGASLRGKMGDAEGLTRDTQGGWLVSFEQRHRVWRYPDQLSLPATEPALLSLPEPLRRLAPPNGGVETVEMLGDGTVLVVAEEAGNGDGQRLAWILGGSQPQPKYYVTTQGYVPTDATRLSSGRVVFLERHYDPESRQATARLRWLWEDELRRHTRWHPRFAAELGPPLPVDNFEGIAAIPGTKDEQVLLISDDNFASHQRTLIYQLRLSLPQKPGCRCREGR